jgi:hypothetical protein
MFSNTSAIRHEESNYEIIPETERNEYRNISNELGAGNKSLKE